MTATATGTSPEISAELLATLAEIGEEVNSSLDLDEVLARAKALDEEVAAQRGTAYAGESDPYKKPRELDEADEA